MQELAELAGVSVSTVSRALAGKTIINAKTRERVVELAREHGFKPNQVAQNLRLRRAQAIGVIIPMGHEIDQHPSDPFFMTMLGHLADALTDRNFDLLLSRVIPSDDEWLDNLLDSGRVDGAIVIGQSDQVAVLDSAAARHRGLVVWGAQVPGQTYVSVGSDNVRGGLIAGRHLIARGKRKLMFLGNPSPPEFSQRQQGFLQACAEAGLAEPVHTLPIHLTAEAAYAAASAFLDEHPGIDGIFAASDVVAMSVLRALAERGLAVPGDVAVVGYDDIMLAAHTSPPLTTIRQDLETGAKLLVDLLFRQIDGEACESVQLEPQLIVRASS
jgi:DNA-binding LacI/PurR family transcriptional regulator